MKKLKLDYSKWRCRGDGANRIGEGTTMLLNEYGYLCCLGFRCLQLGIPKEELLDVIAPAMLAQLWTIPDLINEDDAHSELAAVAMSINDDEELNEEEREEQLKWLFKRYDIIVEFEGEYEY